MKIVRWFISLFRKRKRREYTDFEKLLMLGEMAYRLDPDAEAEDFHYDCGDR